MMQCLAALALAAAACALTHNTEAHAQTVSGLIGPAQVQSNTVTLDAGGNATWTFTTPFPAAPDITHMPIAVDMANPLICNYTARSATAVSIHCWRTSLLGLLTGLLSGPVTGAQVNLIARYKAG